jgi:hypothetical protein
MCRVGLGSKPSFDDSATMEYNCGSLVRRSLIQELAFVLCGELVAEVVDCRLWIASSV